MMRSPAPAIQQLFDDRVIILGLCFLTWNKTYALFPYIIFIKSNAYLLIRTGDDIIPDLLV